MNKKIKISTNRSFGVVFFILFMIIAIWPLKNSNDIIIWALILSIIFLILGIINSKILTPLNRVWFAFGIFLGNIVAPTVMAIVFFLIVMPTGLLVRFFGNNLLGLKKKSFKKTYWIKKEYKSFMKDQF